jgi:hypothetical protein
MMSRIGGFLLLWCLWPALAQPPKCNDLVLPTVLPVHLILLGLLDQNGTQNPENLTGHMRTLGWTGDTWQIAKSLRHLTTLRLVDEPTSRNFQITEPGQSELTRGRNFYGPCTNSTCDRLRYPEITHLEYHLLRLLDLETPVDSYSLQLQLAAAGWQRDSSNYRRIAYRIKDHGWITIHSHPTTPGLWNTLLTPAGQRVRSAAEHFYQHALGSQDQGSLE